MRRTFYSKKSNNIEAKFFMRNTNNNNSNNEINFKNIQKINSCETRKSNNFRNITKSGEKNFDNNKNRLLLKNKCGKEKNKEYTYVFYGDNKYIKTKNKNFTFSNLSAKNQQSKQNINTDYKTSSSKNINKNNINENQKNKGKLHRQFSSDILYVLNRNNKIFNCNNNFISLKKNDTNKSGKNSCGIFPDIYPLNKRKENDLNINNNFFNNILSDNNLINKEQLNQLHKNFINSIITDKSSFLYNKENRYNKLLMKYNNKNFFDNNNNQKWFNNIKNDKIYEYNEYNGNKQKINDRNKYNRIRKKERSSDNNIFFKGSKKKGELYKDDNVKHVFGKKCDRIKNDKILKKNISQKNSNLSFKEQNNIKKIKTKIKQYSEEKNRMIDKRESKENSTFSLNFSGNNDKNEINSNNNDNNRKNNYLNNNNIIEKDNFNIVFSSLNKNKYDASNIFNFSFKNNNFSYQSSNNMKVEEKQNINVNTEKEIKDNNEKETKNHGEENEQNSKGIFNFKTSSYFFSPKFKNEKKDMKDTNTNIKEIINNVIENYKKVAQAKVSTNLYNLGKLYSNNKMRESQKNFYSTSNFKKNYAEAEDNNNQKDKSKEEKEEMEKNKGKSNSIKLILLSPSEWENHEELWINISKNKYNEKFEKFFLPPNDTDIIISCYLKMYPNKLNICNYSKINSKSKNEDFLSFCIDDTVQNPRNELNKWKKVYKKLIFRWHPDKLFPLLKELKIKNENVIRELQRRSSLIINNINTLYQNITEILNKISINKDKKDNKSKQ